MESELNTAKKNLEQNKEAPASWCVLPWSHIDTTNEGTYRMCCYSHDVLKDEKNNPFHVTQANWEKVINSESMKSVRKNMLRGHWSEECKRCKLEYESGMFSKNLFERSNMAKDVEMEHYPSYLKAKKNTGSDGSISSKKFPIFHFALRFGNLCNLKCVMCGPPNSSKWFDDYQALFKERFYQKELETNVFNWNDNPYFWSQVEKHMSHFRRIYISGGEPLLIKSHYEFLRKCIKTDLAGKLTIKYNSNITRIPKIAWRLWKHFKLIKIGASVDGLSEINDFIRYPSQWNQIEKNLRKLNKTEGNFDLNIRTTVSVLNIWHLPEFIEYIMKANYKNINNKNMSVLQLHPVHAPEYLNIKILEDSFKRKISEHFEQYKIKISQFDWQSSYGSSNGFSWEQKVKRTCQILDNFIRYMNHDMQFSEKKLNKLRKKFIYFLDRLDELRNTNWPKVFPELHESTLKWRNLPDYTNPA